MKIDKKAIVKTYNEVADQNYAARSAVVQELADKYDVSTNVIQGHLVSAGVYIAKAKAKTNSDSGTKEDYANAFRAVTGMKLASISNMTKKDLAALWEWHVESYSVREAE